MLIGDPALDFALGPHEHEIWDLGAAWYELTNLPFVYAVWALRRGVENAALRRLLREARDFGLDTLDSIIRTRTEYDLRFPQGLPELAHPLPPRLRRKARPGEVHRTPAPARLRAHLRTPLRGVDRLCDLTRGVRRLACHPPQDAARPGAGRRPRLPYASRVTLHPPRLRPR